MGISRNISERQSPVRLVAKDGSAGKTERLWADWSLPLREPSWERQGAKGRAYTKLVVSVIRNQNKAGAEVSDFPPSDAGVLSGLFLENYREATSQLVVCFF